MKKRRTNSGDSNWLKDAEFNIENRKWLSFSSNIARRILAAIKDKKEVNPEYNQEILASNISVSSQYISKVLKGRENLSLKTIAKISDALGVELISFPDYRYSKMNSKGIILSNEFRNYYPYTLGHSQVNVGDTVLTGNTFIKGQVEDSINISNGQIVA